MRVLALDTATAATTVALLDGDSGRTVERRDDPPAGARPRHTTRLLELVREVLGAAGCDWADLDRIAVGTGPGTFTGLRIGVATARALAEARSIPLVGISTLHSLASCAGAAPGEVALAVIDARRGEVFAAGWAAADAPRGDARPMVTPRAAAPEVLGVTIAGLTNVLAVGDGAVKFREALASSGARIPEAGSARHRVSAVGHCRLALALAAEPPEDVRPDYVRQPDAQVSLGAGRQR